MNAKEIIRLSLVGSLLLSLNGCGDSSSSKEDKGGDSNQSVTKDTTPPVITLKGDSQVSIVQNSTFKDLGATAVDDVDGVVEVKSSGVVNTGEIGNYSIVYRAVDSSNNESNKTRTIKVIAPVSRGSSYVPPVAEKNYYVVPIAKKSSSVSNIDLTTGEVTLNANDIRGNKSGLALSRVYTSYDDSDETLGTFKTNYESSIDAKLPEQIKSNRYETQKESCEMGWKDIDSQVFLGKLDGTTAIYNPETTLCDIYSNSEIVASLLTQHVKKGKSDKLHTLSRPNGTNYVFYKKENKWVSVSKTPLKFEETKSGFKITTLSDSIETYNKEGKLLSVSRNGQTTKLSYNAKGQLTKVTDPFKQSIELKYDDKLALVTEVKSYDDTKVKYAYNKKKQLVKVTYADKSSKTYSYDAHGNLKSMTDASGVVQKTFKYNAKEKAVETEGVKGANKTIVAYSNDKTKVTQTTGETSYAFTVLNSKLLTNAVTTDEGTTTTEYDSHGYPTKVVNKLGVVTKTTYDEKGLLIEKRSNADTDDEKITLKSYATNFRKPTKVVEAGVATFYEYNSKGLLTKKIVGSVTPSQRKLSAQKMSRLSKVSLKSSNLQTQVTSYEYNEQGLQTKTTAPNGATTQNEYDANGNRAKTTNALGFTSETTKFDKVGRPLESRDINGKITKTVYDKMGRVLSSTRDGQTTSYVYDVNGRNIKTTYPDGRVDEKVYDASGNVVESWNNQGDKTVNVYDANNNLVKTQTFKDGTLTNQSETEYDAKNRVVANIDAQGNKTTYSYNAKGQKTKTTNALGRVTSYEYDSQGRLKKEINADGKATLYSYNKEGQRSKVVTPNGAEFAFEYDALKRVTKKLNPDRGTTTYTYDVSGNVLTETNAKGEVKTYTYDIANRKTSTSYSTDATLNESYEYDQGANAKGKLTKISDASGSLAFAYDAKGNLASKTQTIDGKPFTINFSYNEDDKLTAQTLPSGKTLSYGYNAQGELESISIDGSLFIGNIKTNQNGLVSYEYADGSKHTREYDTNGRVTKLIYPNYTEKIDYNVVSNITSITADSVKKAFGFDNLDRLTKYENNQTKAFQNFAYDANGNRLSQNQEVNRTRRFSYTPNSNTLTAIKYYHRVDENTTEVTKEINYSYDATGNIIADEKHSYSYDGRNRLTAIDNNVTYQYNYDNKRVSKTVNGVTTYFIYSGHMLIGEYDQNANPIKEYVYNGSTPIATITPTKTYKVYADHLDTPRRVADENNNIVWKWESKPFGESKATGTLTFNLRFPGQYYDNETETHYNINRDYNPVTGRYIQSDPIGFDGGVNGFGYVGGKPINKTDIYGLKVWLAEKAIESTWYTRIGGHVWLIIEFDTQEEYIDVLYNVYNLLGLNINNYLRANGNQGKFVLRAGPSSGSGGNLIKSIGIGNSVTTWRQRYQIFAPSGNEAQFIVDLMEAAVQYQNNLQYDGLARDGKYNSNSFISGLLVASGISVNNIPDPWWYQPGLDKPIPLNSTAGGYYNDYQ